MEGGDLTDISNSPAYNFLDELAADGKLTKAAVHMYKEKYARLHEYVLRTYENEKNLLKKAKQLNQELLGEKIKMENSCLRMFRKHEEASVCANLEKEKEKGLKEFNYSSVFFVAHTHRVSGRSSSPAGPPAGCTCAPGTCPAPRACSSRTRATS